MEFGVDFDQTAVDLWYKITWNFHENPCHIFYTVILILLIYVVYPWINDMEWSWNLISISTKLQSTCDMKNEMTWNLNENPCH